MIDIHEYKDAEKVFYFFEEISKIPHASENTAQIADYLENFAKDRGLFCIRDKSDNVIIRKSATVGYESSPAVIFQGHTDMVADKVKGCDIDMDREGLRLYRDGDFLRAEGTTLGGDDGVALAYALAVLDSDDIPHPEFEALFTSDEEIGLLGATALDTSPLHGKLMINIDSDDEGVFTVGCAGGMRIDTKIDAKPAYETVSGFTLTVSGLRGGHSGTEIDKGRSNAIKIMAGILGKLTGVRISSVCGGNADNAIPRSAECVFTCDNADILPDLINAAYSENTNEPDIRISYEKTDNIQKAYSKDSSERFIGLLNMLPSGVIAMSSEISGLVETSANLGIVSGDGDALTASLSIRSSKNAAKEELRLSIRGMAESFGASVFERGAYPAWEYRKESRLRDIMSKTYSDMYGKNPEIITIHAGLECGIFSDKIEGLDCVSMGPDNFDIHTPDERLSISSTARVWEYLKEVLKRL
jgi:dipeptidase D